MSVYLNSIFPNTKNAKKCLKKENAGSGNIRTLFKN
jgi:hypothetical protein